MDIRNNYICCYVDSLEAVFANICIMKTRVIKNGDFYEAQVKKWFTWNSVCANSRDAYFGLAERYKTKEEAIEVLERYVKRQKKENQVVWEKEIV